jgi:hypothetical protein
VMRVLGWFPLIFVGSLVLDRMIQFAHMRWRRRVARQFQERFGEPLGLWSEKDEK